MKRIFSLTLIVTLVACFVFSLSASAALTVIKTYDFEDLTAETRFDYNGLTGGGMVVDPNIVRSQAASESGDGQNNAISLNTDPAYAKSGTQSLKITAIDLSGVWLDDPNSTFGFWIAPADAAAGTVISVYVYFKMDADKEGMRVVGSIWGGSEEVIGEDVTLKANTWTKITFTPTGAASGWYIINFPGINKNAEGEIVPFTMYIDDLTVYSGTAENSIVADTAEEPNTESPSTFDGGVVAYAVTGFVGMAGAMVVSKKRR